GVPLNQRGVPIRAAASDADRRARDRLQAWNRRQIETALLNLAAWGIVPQRTDGRDYVRQGTVDAERLTSTLTWTTEAGSTLVGNPGDWLVVSPDGSRRTVAAAEFALLYAAVDGSTYRRLGVVRARRTLEAETVQSLEGPSLTTPGDWVVTDERGHRWPVPDAQFRESYRPRTART